MNKNLQTIQDIILESESLKEEQKNSILKALKEAYKEIEVTAFKLERTEKVKKTTAILLEETIEELEQKRKAVEEQNRELEIEKSLEKVRTIAMGMREPANMLEVCKTISFQLQSLGVKEIRNVQTAIFYEQRGTYMNYEYYAKHDNTFITETVYTNNKIHNEFATKMLSGKGETFITHIKGDEVKDWIAYQKTTNVFIDKYLETASSLNYYWFSLGPVALGISTYYPLTDAEINLFRRFLKVFELAYQRYLDIEKAETQAREAKIEAALEKVRGRAMAMRSSEDLGATVNVFFKELKNLGFLPRRCGVAIIDEARRSAYNMITTAGNIGDSFEITGNVNLDSHFVLTNMLLNWKVQQDYFLELDTKQMEEYYRILRPQVAVTNFNDVRQYGYYLHFKEGMFYVWMDKELQVNDLQIFRRFTQVIGLTYRRHLDLQKAEAQAREAQIELSLERIRAQVTAMRESSELLDIVVTMRSEFVALGHEAHYFWHMRWLPDRYDKAMTSGDGTRIGMVMTLPRHIHRDVKLVADWEKSNEPTLVFAMDVDTAVEYVEKMITLGDFQQVDPQAPTLDDIRHIGGLTFIMARTTHGEIGFSLPGTVPNPPEESVKTLARFAGVFDLAYKRFEDLKSTERQHREAQIELALERTRTQSMLMKHSGELNDISKTFHEQLLNLGIDSEFSFVWLPDEAKQEHMFWATWVNEINGVTQYQSKAIKYPLDKTEPGTAKCYRDWKSGQSVHETYIPPDQIVSFFAEWEALLSGAEKLKPELFPHGIYYTEAYMKYGCFGIDIRRQLTSEEKEIVRRFSVEFERTYTRFLDLQKAEAQAREAQIEAALERVRSKTMGMQRSDELQDAAVLLFQQVVELGVPAFGSGFNIWDDDRKSSTAWMAGQDRMQPPFKTLSSEDIFLRIFEAAQRGESLFVEEQSGEALKTHYKYMFSIPIFKEIADKMATVGQSFPTFQIMHCAFFSSGYLMFISFEPVPDAYDIFKRFAKVFEQTYTRFLDLQKAEEQNKIIHAENERKTKELEDARQLQLSMLPKELPKLPHLDIAVYMKTATEVGGDYYDYNVDVDGTLTFVVGDATGHGMMSGMMVSIMKSFFISNKSNIELKQFFENANNSIKDMHLGRLMMACMGVQITSEKIIATNAGMPSLIYFRNKSQKAGEFVSHNFPLGGMKGTNYSLKEIKYERGDTLLLMSDGFAELKNENNEQYGYARITKEFKSVALKSSTEIVEHLNNSAYQWISGVEPDDDVTFVVIKVK